MPQCMLCLSQYWTSLLAYNLVQMPTDGKFKHNVKHHAIIKIGGGGGEVGNRIGQTNIES